MLGRDVYRDRYCNRWHAFRSKCGRNCGDGEATGKNVIASGGISTLEDLINLKEYQAQGVIGAIVGKAIYTNRFTVRKR